MRGMDFDRIASSAPLDKTAATVTGAGEAFVPRIQIQDYLADMPPIKPITRDQRVNPEFVDFTGVVIGRVTVIGIQAKSSKGNGAFWILRCKCGAYCKRSAKSLKAATAGSPDFVSMCGMCAYNQRLASGKPPRAEKTAPKLKAFGWKSKARAAE